MKRQTCGEEETCGSSGCEPMRERALWRLPSDPAPPENYELDDASVLDATTGLRWQREPVTVDNGAQARDVCERLGGGYRIPHWIELATITTRAESDEARLVDAFAPGIVFVFDYLAVGPTDSNDRIYGDDEPVLAVLDGADDAAPAEAWRGGALCVKSTRTPAHVERRFVVQSGTSTDTVTGLVWQSDGSTPRVSGGVSQSRGSGGFDHWEAEQYCASLSLAGFDRGWRLPTVLELASLFEIGFDVESGRQTCCVDPEAFSTDQIDNDFWTSVPTASTEPNEFDDPTRWGVDLGPRRFDFYTHGATRTRCVRDAE